MQAITNNGLLYIYVQVYLLLSENISHLRQTVMFVSANNAVHFEYVVNTNNKKFIQKCCPSKAI